jgi:uncharacterized membrane protein
MEILKKTPAMREEKSPREDRIVLLSDGVFAIAMTLLILDVRLPEGLPHSTFSGALNLLLPKVISYAITFIVISTYWSVHRRFVNYLTRIDASFIQLNLLFLFFITALPIPTTFAFQQQYTDQYHLSTIIYTLSLAMTGLTLAALWLYATWKHRLVDPNLEHDAINYFLVRSLISPVIFLLSLLILLVPGVDPNDVYFSWFVIYIVYFILRRFRTRLFPRLTGSSEQSAETVLTDPTPVRES